MADSFNPDYTGPELRQIERRICEAGEQVNESHIGANNIRPGHAPKTVEWLAAVLIAKAKRDSAKKQKDLPLIN